MKLFKTYDDTYWLAITFMEIGSAYYHLENYDKAYERITIASLKESHKMERDDFWQANLGNIGAGLNGTGSI